METVVSRLRQLRGWFVAWFIIQSVIGTVTAIQVIDTLRAFAFFRSSLASSPRGLEVASSLFVEAVLLALGLWIFHGLLQLRSWARLTLLVVGWISALGAMTSLLSMGSLGLVRGLLPGVDLGGLAAVGLLTNSLNLLFWGYAILTLQFDREVRAVFVSVPAAA